MESTERMAIRNAATIVLSFLRDGTTRIVRHVTTRAEHYAHSGKPDRSTSANEMQGILARGVSNARADRSFQLTIAL
jgi:hypothetical protein